jgi:hypothetical protein
MRKRIDRANDLRAAMGDKKHFLDYIRSLDKLT